MKNITGQGTVAATAVETKPAPKAPKAKAKTKAITKSEPAAPAKKGVVGWQKGLRPLRSLVNDLQNHIEDGVKDKVIVQRLQMLAKTERAKIEKTETIPARLDRRFLKYTATKV